MEKENDEEIRPSIQPSCYILIRNESSNTWLHYSSRFVIEPEHIGKASRSKVQSRLVPLSNRGTADKILPSAKVPSIQECHPSRDHDMISTATQHPTSAQNPRGPHPSGAL